MALSKTEKDNTETELLQIINRTNTILEDLIKDLNIIRRNKGKYTNEEVEKAYSILLEVKKIKANTYRILNPKFEFKTLDQF
tara:strand:+ start:1263 stop:1508 length:246 start_codon:yes stop_codon:yes gene_type:complete